MKLISGVVATLVGCAAAAQQAAEVYMLPTSGSSSPSVPRSLARLILLQRLAPLSKGPSISDLPEDVEKSNAVSLLNEFGKTVPPLFGSSDNTAPRQLVVMLEGMSPAQIKEISQAFDTKPAFTIVNPPALSANEHLLQHDFYNAGVTNEHGCSISNVANPLDDTCWKGSQMRQNIMLRRCFVSSAISTSFILTLW